MRNSMAFSITQKPKSVKIKEKRKEQKYDFGICRICARNRGGHSLETRGSGFIVQNLIIPGFTFQYCLVTSNKVIPDSKFQNYRLEFKQFESTKLVTCKLEEIASPAEVGQNSGLIFIGISIDLIKKKNKKLYKDITDRLFKVVNKDIESYEHLNCYFVDDSKGESFVKNLKIERNEEEFKIHDGVDTHKTYSQLINSGDRKPYGGVILKRIKGELIVVGALDFTEDERRTISPTFFPLSALSTWRGKHHPIKKVVSLQVDSLHLKSFRHTSKVIYKIEFCCVPYM